MEQLIYGNAAFYFSFHFSPDMLDFPYAIKKAGTELYLTV